ncbi:hypothetical protein [Nocardia sp. NPDC003963]
MDRPPPGPADGRDRPPYPTDPTRHRDSGTFPHPGDADPDPATRRPELYRPHHDATPVPDDTFPTEPIPVLRLPGWDSGNATYEGSWSDWVARANTDSADIRPGEEPATVRSPVADPGPAAPAAETDHDPAPPPADSSPAGARERLRRRLTPPEPATPEPVRAEAPAGGRKRAVPILLGVAGVAALGTAAYVQFVVVGGEETRSPVAAAPSATAPAAPGTDPHCAAERIGNTVQGNGPGGTESGPEAIFGFQHAYYVARSGEQARALVAADAAVPPAADIQRGIDSIPAGTTYCVRIDPGAFVGQYTVAITEFRPGTAPLEYNPQLVTAMRIGDRTLITGIGPMP